jgi:hypothetical protein
VSVLTAADRARLARFADLLIPRGDGMPSGSEADAHGAQLDRVFEVRPDLVQTVADGLAVLPDPLPASVDAFDPALFARLRGVADALTSAYFIDPEVARRVGYRRRTVIPIRFDDDLAALTAAVTRRGPIYRPTPAPIPEEN